MIKTEHKHCYRITGSIFDHLIQEEFHEFTCELCNDVIQARKNWLNRLVQGLKPIPVEIFL